MKPIINLPAEHYLEMIRNNKPFQLSRFGDGEVICMNFANHHLKQNCDGSKYLQGIKKPMRQIFINNYDYYHCLLDCTFDENGQEFKKFIDKNCPNMSFYNGEIWQHLSFDGRITELMEAISPHNPVFVGGRHIRNVVHMKGISNATVYEIASKDSFLDLKRILDDIRYHHSQGKRMFLFSAGFTTKIVIDILYKEFKDDTFLIDMGSVFDPYCGKLSREGMVYYGYSKFQPYTNLILE